MSEAVRYTLPRSARLAGRTAFGAVFAGKVKVSRGSFSLWGKANGLGYCRFGTSIGRPSGNAVVRNLIKRRVREGYRHVRKQLEGGYDLVLVIRPHEPMSRQEYQTLIVQLHGKLHGQLAGNDAK